MRVLTYSRLLQLNPLHFPFPAPAEMFTTEGCQEQPIYFLGGGGVNGEYKYVGFSCFCKFC